MFFRKKVKIYSQTETPRSKIKKNLVSLSYAILAALLIRSFFFEPFSIPSGSMYPNLKVGDYLFVSKYSYGFSKHSLPFSIPVIPNRLFYKEPLRGDIVVFKTPEDNKTDYIKRLIGLPGDKIYIKNNQIFINDVRVKSEKVNDSKYKSFDVDLIRESLDNVYYDVFEFKKSISFLNTNDFAEVKVPQDHFFVLGDNRDNSQDSRFVGFIPKANLVGRAEVVCVSFDTSIGSFLKFWTWYPALRKDRFFVSLRPKSN